MSIGRWQRFASGLLLLSLLARCDALGEESAPPQVPPLVLGPPPVVRSPMIDAGNSGGTVAVPLSQVRATTVPAATRRASLRDSARYQPAWEEASWFASIAPALSAETMGALVATPLNAESVEGVLLKCTVRVVLGQYDNDFGAALTLGHTAGTDLKVSFRFGSSPLFEAIGPEDREVAVVAIPAVHLQRGQTVSVHAIDRDPFGQDEIGTATTRFAGSFPLSFSARNFTVACDAVATTTLDALAASDWEDADRMLTDAEDEVRSAREITAQQWGRIYPVRAALTHAASLLGWGDVRIVARLERLNTLTQLLRQRAFPSATPSQPAARGGGYSSFGDIPFQGRMLAGTCTQATTARQCQLELEVVRTHRGPGAGGNVAECVAIDRNGRALRLNPFPSYDSLGASQFVNSADRIRLTLQRFDPANPPQWAHCRTTTGITVSLPIE